MTLKQEREQELERIRKIHDGEIADSRTKFAYVPSDDGCGCATCEKRRRLGIDCHTDYRKGSKYDVSKKDTRR